MVEIKTEDFLSGMEGLSDESVASISDHVKGILTTHEENVKNLTSTYDTKLSDADKQMKDLMLKVAGYEDGSRSDGNLSTGNGVTDRQKALQKEWADEQAAKEAEAASNKIQQQLKEQSETLFNYKKADLAREGIPQSILDRAKDQDHLDDLLATYNAVKDDGEDSQRNTTISTGTLGTNGVSKTVSSDPLVNAEREVAALIRRSGG